MNNVEMCYLTVFSKHTHLIKLIEEYGFIKSGNVINQSNEFIYIKYLNNVTGDIYKDYRLLNTNSKRIYLFFIHSKYHSIMFPDSLLKTETPDILADLSYTNSIKMVSDVIRGLVALSRGENNREYFSMLISSFKSIYINQKRKEASLLPQKITKYAFVLFGALLCLIVGTMVPLLKI